ncbi:MAG TPA: hypothetical protein VHZ95_15640, partial [Polyangiales bacterium]|nr:hypothetical protein [Polyangiales bacterium]
MRASLLPFVCLGALAISCSSDQTAPSAVVTDTRSTSAAQDPNSASIGPVALTAQEETTVCVTVRMNNDVALMVTHFQAELAPGSHHLIVYKSQATVEQPTAASCSPFSGLL